MPTPRRASPSIFVAAAMMFAVPMIGQFEGKRNDPYKDIVGVQTVCYGETRVSMKHYTDRECSQMLENATRDFAEPIAKATNTIADKPKILAAATSLSYNIGLGSYMKSSVRRLFLQGRFKEACHSFLNWKMVTKNGKRVVSQGLLSRRLKEEELCLQGL